MQFSDYSDSDAGLELNGFVNKSTMASVMFSIETLVEESRLVITFKDECEYGDESIMNSKFWDFWAIRILNQGTKRLIFQKNTPGSKFCFQLRP